MATDTADDVSAMSDHPHPRSNPAQAKPQGPGEHAFRHALSHFATGVTAITALDDRGELCGLTANAFSSVSLNPPLVLACISHGARCYEAIRASGRFSVHILRSDQDDVARGFARKGADRSTVCGWRVNDRGFALLETFHTALECSLHEAHPGGDHAILVGRVEAVHAGTEQSDPLLYYQGRMFPLRSSG